MRTGTVLAAKRDIGSLVSMPVSRHGFSVETGGKQSDLTPLLVLVPDPVPVADLAPEIAKPRHALVADLAHEPAPAGDTVFAQGIRRLRHILGIGGSAT
jgi:hypothetical protein